MLASQDDNDNVNLTILLCKTSAQYLNLISICFIYNNTKLHAHISERLFNECPKVFFFSCVCFYYLYYINMNYLIPNPCFSACVQIQIPCFRSVLSLLVCIYIDLAELTFLLDYNIDHISST